MSWASHDPERYDKLTREGIAEYLTQSLVADGFELTEGNIETCLQLADTMQTLPELRGVYVELQRLASLHILHAEQDYFGSIADGLKADRDSHF